MGDKGKVVPLRSLQAHLGDRRYSSYSFLTSALEGGEVVSITPRPHFTPGKIVPGTHCIGGWVGPRAGLDAEVRGKILCPCRGSNLGCPVCSQTLYWLSCTTGSKWTLGRYSGGLWSGFSWLSIGFMAGSSEYGDDPLGSGAMELV
jgi:hypothetical protein